MKTSTEKIANAKARPENPAFGDFNFVYAKFAERYWPLPKPRTVQGWLRDAGVRTTKRNRKAKRGGGRIWYHLGDVQEFLESLSR